MKSLLKCLMLAFLFSQFAHAQCDYTQDLYTFTSVKKIFFGVLPDYRGIMDSLFLDVYLPEGTTETERPLIIWAYGGGFFQGKREDFAPVCEDMARKGMVSATIDYRLGFEGPGFGLNPPFAYDAAEVLRAGYRGATDMKGAIRFLKARHKEYGIDLKRVWLGGASAGAIVALNAAFLNNASEKPQETGEITPVNNRARPDLGPVEGTLNLNGYDDSVQGVFNIFGALLDTSAISPGDQIAVFSYHQTGDPIVPCKVDRPYYPVPLISQNYPLAYGSCAISDRLTHLGLPDEYWDSWIYTGQEHALHDENAVLDYFLTQAQPILCPKIIATEQNLADLVNIYPNPGSPKLNISCRGLFASAELTHASGMIVARTQGRDALHFDTSLLSEGMYYLRIRSGSQSLVATWVKL
ncbi:MAG: carboxylesterase family protein [Saprospiraceae bacterium]|nr:carboxylesterase family protein [Saprospiraceae bacterium]